MEVLPPPPLQSVAVPDEYIWSPFQSTPPPVVKACRFGEHVWHSKPAVRDLQLSRGDPQKEEEEDKQLSKVPSATVVLSRQEEQGSLEERRLHSSRSLTSNCISSSSPLVKSVVARPTQPLLLQSIILYMCHQPDNVLQN